MEGENYKDVIISQPPAMYSNTRNVSLENFKGILLCEKPSSLGVAALEDPKAFIPSNPTGNPLGYGPTIEAQQHQARRESARMNNSKQRRNKHSEYLSRHRKWLYSFSQAMRAMKEEEVQREVAMAEKAKRFAEMERQKRDAALQSQKAELPLEPYNIQDLAKDTKGEKAGKSKRSAKPKWAMTPEEAFMEDDEDEDTHALLDFAKKLDYDKFMADFTIKEALQVMRERVMEIAKANDWSPEDILCAAEREGDDDLQSAVPMDKFQEYIQKAARSEGENRKALPGGPAEHAEEWDSSTRGELLKRAISQDALQLADRILQQTPSMQKVHTRQSLARVLQKCALKDENVDAALEARTAQLGKMDHIQLAAATAIGPPLEAAPAIVKISPDSTALEASQSRRVLVDLQHSKERTQNLPYLYRCPAI